MLDIFERLLTRESEDTGEDILSIAAKRRPRIEHAQIMRQQDLSRAGRLGGKFAVLKDNPADAFISHYQRTTNACHQRYVVCRNPISACQD